MSEESIMMYDRASDSASMAGAGINPALIVSDVVHNDPSHFIRYLEHSPLYSPHDGYRRSKERYVMQSYYRSPFSQLTFPINQLPLTIYNSIGILKETYISISLPVNTGANVTLPRGWGYLLIDQVTISFSGSNLTWYQDQIVQWLHHVCQSQEQFDSLWDLGGAARTGTWTAGQPTAQVLLPLPWCDPSLPPLDTALLQSSSLQVMVSLRNITQVAGGSGAAALTQSLASGSFVARTGKFVAATDGILPELVYHSFLPDKLVYALLFESYQNQMFRNIACSSTTDTSLQLTATTVSMPLMGIVVSCVLSSDASPTGGNPANPAAYVALSDITLTYESIQVVQTLGNEYDLQRIMLAQGRPVSVNNIYFSGGPTAPYTQTNVSNPIYRFVFTLKDQVDMVEYGIHGVTSLVLSFRTPTTANHNLTVSYLYDRAMKFDGATVALQ